MLGCLNIIVESTATAPISSPALAELASELGVGRRKPIPLPPLTSGPIIAKMNEYKNPTYRHLFAWLYLSGQRISEALNLQRCQVSLDTAWGKDFVKIDSQTLKNPDQLRRIIPVPLYGATKAMAQYAWDAIKDRPPNETIFPFSRQVARNQLAKVVMPCTFLSLSNKERFEGNLSIYPHFLRHARATHLFSEYGDFFDLRRHMQFFGWKSPTMSNLYAVANWRDLAAGFR